MRKSINIYYQNNIYQQNVGKNTDLTFNIPGYHLVTRELYEIDWDVIEDGETLYLIPHNFLVTFYNSFLEISQDLFSTDFIYQLESSFCYRYESKPNFFLVYHDKNIILNELEYIPSSNPYHLSLMIYLELQKKEIDRLKIDYREFNHDYGNEFIQKINNTNNIIDKFWYWRLIGKISMCYLYEADEILNSSLTQMEYIPINNKFIFGNKNSISIISAYILANLWVEFFYILSLYLYHIPKSINLIGNKIFGEPISEYDILFNGNPLPIIQWKYRPLYYQLTNLGKWKQIPGDIVNMKSSLEMLSLDIVTKCPDSSIDYTDFQTVIQVLNQNYNANALGIYSVFYGYYDDKSHIFPYPVNCYTITILTIYLLVSIAKVDLVDIRLLYMKERLQGDERKTTGIADDSHYGIEYTFQGITRNLNTYTEKYMISKKGSFFKQPEWIEYFDDSSGSYYYYNRYTDISVWVKPNNYKQEGIPQPLFFGNFFFERLIKYYFNCFQTSHSINEMLFSSIKRNITFNAKYDDRKKLLIHFCQWYLTVFIDPDRNKIIELQHPI